MTLDNTDANCCIVGGGPAGVMLGYLLARQGVRVIVLEKHKDFFRDFRGDTVHPSTLEVMHELGLLEDFLRVPHQEIRSVRAEFGDFIFKAADFSRLPTHCKFIALMPQWDFLDFLSGAARKFLEFDLRMEHEAVDLLHDSGRIVGVQVKTPQGPSEIRADLVIGCDGRHSITRQAGDLPVVEFGVPIDVLWFHITRKPSDPETALGNINYGKVLILINRGDYYQAGLLIRKDSFIKIQVQGLDAFRASIASIAPYLSDRVGEITEWDQVKLLSVQLNRLQRWYRPGLLCIGDAAHAMSPAGGVGINLAIQDAVATANLLGDALRERRVNEESLARVQQRREFPTRVTQQFQALAHKGIERVFETPGPAQAPWQLKLAARIPALPHLLGRGVGMGVRPEHVKGVTTSAACGKRTLVKIAVGVGLFAAAAAIALGAAKRCSQRKRLALVF